MTGVALFALTWPAIACGPDFPNRLLDDRQATLEGLIEGTFRFEASRLIDRPTDTLVAVETIYYDTDSKSTPTPVQASAPVESLYLSAAKAFHEANYEAAREGFEKVLGRPSAEQGSRRLDAMYSLARTQAILRSADAAKTFQRVREEVLAGAVDPQGLAVASFGEEARLRLDDSDFSGAIHLYAEQAARGSTSGRNSLLFVARDVLAEPQRLEEVISDRVGQRLIAAYLYARGAELDEQKLLSLLDMIEQRGIEQFNGADRLAAAAYRSARYDVAAKLAARSDEALAWWVRAKLALRDGKTDAAATAYAKAARAFPQNEDWAFDSEFGDLYGVFSPKCRVQGEIGVLALSRGDYVSALASLYEAGPNYWDDTAYVAERVVTLDELRTFVDAHVPAAAPANDSSGFTVNVATNLRWLLARRLLRSGQGEAAIAYFDNADLANKARRYVAAQKNMKRGGPIERAEATFEAATLARMDGMELLGYELDPDYQVYGGGYDLAPPGHYNDQFEWIEERRQDITLPEQYVSANEAGRVAESRANPLERFHYRYVAVDLASRAADLLPARSQAFAAVLCTATGWINNTDHARGEALWLRYVKHGAYVPWAEDFGQRCQAPDFASAQKRLRFEQIATIKRSLRAAAPYLLAGGVVVVVLLGIVFMRRRARKNTD